MLRLVAQPGSRPKVKAPGESQFASLHKTFRLFRHHMPRKKNNVLLDVIDGHRATERYQITIFYSRADNEMLIEICTILSGTKDRRNNAGAILRSTVNFIV